MIRQGNRRALSRAITLVESSHCGHRNAAAELLDELARHEPREATRIGLTGTPGAGKSTFMDSFGMFLIAGNRSVAVLAVDPSSLRTGGSILGDKTRMDRLSKSGRAFIRPSPAGQTSGGVTRRSRECVFLCEQAGFDIVVVETTGVGQTEATVAEMTDIFVLVVAPGGGDELQGVKRGITELADLILVNKSDGELGVAAGRTCANYQSALHLLRKREFDPPGFPKAMQVSAIKETGIASFWNEIEQIVRWRKEGGFWHRERSVQKLRWFRHDMREEVLELLLGSDEMRARMESIERLVLNGRFSHSRAISEAMGLVRSAQACDRENSAMPLDAGSRRQ